MPHSLTQLLDAKGVLLADGATGTNLFEVGLEAGEAPEMWLESHPDRITALHQAFVDNGADIILSCSFGANRQRLKLHQAEDRTHALNRIAAELARAVADAAGRPVVVGGSVGPTGELLQPLGALSYAEAVEAFREQIAGLKDGGVDVVWIETMSAAEEVRAAAEAARVAVTSTREQDVRADARGRATVACARAEVVARIVPFRDGKAGSGQTRPSM